jgi:hypothetical protein
MGFAEPHTKGGEQQGEQNLQLVGIDCVAGV